MAMPYWGIALALGPNINSAMEKKDERRAVEMVQKARQLADHTTRGEKAYIKRWSHGTWAGRGPSEGDSMKPMRRRWISGAAISRE